jgi:N-acetylmuramoyl-L-alanine amidase
MALYNAEAQANAIVLGLTGQVPPSSEPERDRTVLELQQALNRLQIRDHQGKALDESGAMNEETAAAVKRFQAIVGVTETGIGGATTWKAIDQILAKPILRKNHAGGPVVKYLQHRVGSEVDGIYGPATAVAVEQLQEQKGLVADGIVGPQTWGHLIG